MGQTILLADDSITIQKVIELTFSDEDFTLHTVGNGQKAIEEIRSIRPDIVLCDIIMPEKNGYEVCEFIKSSDDLKHIPVLLLTGAFEPFDQERARKAGCDGFLAKPFEPQTLISKVRELLAAAAQAPTVQAPLAEGTIEPARPVAVAPPPAPPAPEPIPPAIAELPPTVELSTVSEPPPVSGAPFHEESSTIMADSFAVEAGERELSVEPEDQTVLLNDDESPMMPSEDIWSEVQQTPPSLEPLAPTSLGTPDDVSTVYMESTPEPLPAEEAPGATGFDDFAAIPVGGPTNPTDSGTWILPSPEEEQIAQPAEPELPTVEPIPSAPQATEPMPQLTEPMQLPNEPELTPLGDLGGFDDFSGAGPTGAPEYPGAPETPGSQEPIMEPADLEVEDPTFFASPEAFKMPPPRPPAAPVPPKPPPVSPEPPVPDMAKPPAPPSLGEERIFSDSTLAEPEPEPFPMVEPTPLEEPTPFIEEPTGPPVAYANKTLDPGELDASQIPAPVEASPGQDRRARQAGARVEPPVPQEPTFEEAFVSSQADLPTGEPVEETIEPTLVTKVKKHVAAAESAGGSDELDVLAERVAEKVITKLSDKIIKEIAWEIVPDLAQTLIQKEIDELKAKIPE